MDKSKPVSDAEATVKFAIFSGITECWNQLNDPHFGEIITVSVLKRLFAPHLVWALEEYLREIKAHNTNSDNKQEVPPQINDWIESQAMNKYYWGHDIPNSAIHEVNRIILAFCHGAQSMYKKLKEEEVQKNI